METSVQSANANQAFPDMAPMRERLHFRTERAEIALGDQRMILMHTAAINDLRTELIASLGSQTARTLLTRIGFSMGTRDAQLALQLHSPEEGIFELLVRGGQLHALQGVALVEPISADLDIENGRCSLEFFWKHSFEDERQALEHDTQATPVCWLETGYASGYLSACVGKLILVREVECRAMGFDACRVIARPASEWDDAEADLQFLEAPVFPEALAPKGRGQAGKHRSALAALERSKSRSDIVGLSPAYQAAIGKINRVAATGATVLLLGESGVGKSTFARLLHEQSRRADGPFVAINCATIPETLMESELFGVERGAFTGADAARAGRFELAEGGTLFLDEVATLPLVAQGKLLRVLETGQFERLGSGTARQADVRIVAATNEDLWQAVRAGRFREDLFFRLHVFPIEIPPLRQRKEDLPVLIEHFMQRFTHAYGRNAYGLTPEAMSMLLGYSWPGNIRELSNVVERAVILCEDGRAIDAVHVVLMKDLRRGAAVSAERAAPEPLAALAATVAPEQPSRSLLEIVGGLMKDRGLTLEDMENTMVDAAIQRSDGNMTRAAALLGISRGQLLYRRKRTADDNTTTDESVRGDLLGSVVQ
ncbi:sigma-54-dependent Fis family transcriptional regulator [Paraburkholderia sp. HP33-1]|uniref:sigma-54-dependent Fis family transcriptional regulator n=1 Tax=Paraburkholderia sp. HP33-1 TaxID=2883243 RepID=UPI001F18F6EF|nr:sigma-54-dependent Fis family transcriptional regulator [Paraburkholderia sp. HP33-1]